jgi:hypothetical protein
MMMLLCSVQPAQYMQHAHFCQFCIDVVASTKLLNEHKDAYVEAVVQHRAQLKSQHYHYWRSSVCSNRMAVGAIAEAAV